MRWPHRTVLDAVDRKLDDVWYALVKKVMGLGPADNFDIFGPGDEGDLPTQQAA